MKKLVHWKLLLLLSIILSLSFLNYVIYTDYKTLPSENWSKYIKLYQSDVVDQTNNYYKEILDAKAYNNSVFLVHSDQYKLFINQYDEAGALIASNEYPLDTLVEKLSMTIENNQIRVLIYEQSNLHQYLFDLSSRDLLSSTTIDENIQDIKFKNDHALYLIDDTFKYFDGKTITEITENKKVEQFDFAYSSDIVYVNLLEYDNGTYFFNMYDFNPKTKSFEYHKIDKISTLTGTVSLDTDMLYDGDQLYNTLFLKNTKFGQNFENNFILDMDFNILRSYKSSNMSYDPNTQFVIINDQVLLSYNDMSFIGKLEVGSQNQFYTNVFLKSIDESTPIEHSPYKILTKSKNYAPNAVITSTDHYDYLITNEIDDKTNTIFLSSNHPSIIEKSKQLDFKDLREIFFGSLTFFPPALMTLMLILISLLFPVIMIIIPISILKMTWVERNPNKMLVAAVIAYVLSKVYYVWSVFDTMVFPSDVYGIIPFHLSTPLWTSITLILTTLISMLCLKLYLMYKPHSHFISSFFVFYFIDMIQYLCFVTVYIVMFM